MPPGAPPCHLDIPPQNHRNGSPHQRVGVDLSIATLIAVRAALKAFIAQVWNRFKFIRRILPDGLPAILLALIKEFAVEILNIKFANLVHHSTLKNADPLRKVASQRGRPPRWQDIVTVKSLLLPLFEQSSGYTHCFLTTSRSTPSHTLNLASYEHITKKLHELTGNRFS
jgi:hypothetical protein